MVAGAVAGGRTVESTIGESPDKFLGGVVEAKFGLGVDAGTVATITNGFSTSELELFNEVFMTNLGEAAAFFRVKGGAG